MLVDKGSKDLNPYASQSYTVITVISGYNNFINKIKYQINYDGDVIYDNLENPKINYLISSNTK